MDSAAVKISAKTKVYAVIGCPIGHSFSPAIHNTLSELLNIDMTYNAFKVEPEGLKTAIDGAYQLGIQGLNVTVPHKQEVMKTLCRIDDFAVQIGAVNTLKYTPNGYEGYNTDVFGLEECIKSRGIELKDKTMVLLGAGGAAKAAAVMAASNQVRRLYIVNRTIKNAEDIAANIKKYYNNTEVLCLGYDEIENIENIDICVQTTSKGMSPNTEQTPVESREFFKKCSFAVDIIFNPWETKFLTLARENGCMAVNGFDMLFYQAVKSYEIWNEIKVPSDIKLRAKELLEKYYTKR